MDKFAKKYLSKRRKSKKHSARLSERKARKNIIDKAINKIYTHQNAAFLLEDIEYSDKFDEIEIAHYFYNNCFVENNLKTGLEGNDLSAEDFLNEILSKFSDDNPLIKKRSKNKIYYLLGDVGSGKSAFVNYLITTSLRRYSLTENLVFIRLDLNKEDFTEGISEKLFLNKTVEKIKSVFERNPKLIPDEISEKYERLVGMDYSNNPKKFISHLIDIFKSYKNFLFIYDNIDFIVHQYDRDFFKEEAIETFNEVSKKAIAFVMQFFSDSSELSNLASVFLFVLRNSTYNRIQDKPMISGRPGSYNNDNNVYTLEKESWESVLDSRNKLFRFALDKKIKDESLKKEAINMLNEIDYETNERKSRIKRSVEHVISLTNLQHREFVEYLAKFIWINYTKPESKRITIIEKKPVSSLTYMLGGKRLFSQEKSQFPNIYLNELLSRICIERNDCRNTYWLKRLILEYIKVETLAESEAESDFISEIFQSYGKIAVKEALGCLSDVGISNLISVDTENLIKSSTNHSLMLTDRGLYCLENVFDKFTYLQLVVDDYKMPIPKSIKKEFPNLFSFQNQNLDYSYITEQLSSGEELINLKAKQVIIFIDVLEATLKCEMKLHKSCFDSLKELDVEIPSVNKMRESLLNEIKTIFQYSKSRRNKIIAELDEILKSSSSRQELIINSMNSAEDKRINHKQSWLKQ